jgi:mono/diheme cytochrome c family protein
MRHLMANIFTYAIAALLFIGAALFARMRSSQYLLTNETAVLAQYAPRPAGFAWRELGPQAYARNCMNCHGADGDGWDQYPGMGAAGALFRAEGGRDYLIDVHLHGLDSPRWRAPMPPMRHMHDVELAAVINYVLAEYGGIDFDDGLVEPDDVTARRDARPSPSQVEAGRPQGIPPAGRR